MNSSASSYPAPIVGMAPEGVTGIVLWAVFTLFLAPIAVILRFWSRRIKNIALAWNDWAAVIALVPSIAIGCVITEAVVNAGLGAHIYQLPNPEEQIPHNLKELMVYEILWAGANTFVRLSILHLYITIFRTPKFRLVAKILMVVACLFWVAMILATLLFCTPFEANWNSSLPGAKCGSIHASGISGGTFNLAIDFAVVCLPMPALWGLQLPLRKKFALLFIFGIGFIICAFSVVRIVALAALGPDSDLTYAMNRIGWWSVLETSLGVINCCLPVLQPVVSKLSGSSGWSRNRSTNRYDQSYEAKSIQVVTEREVVLSRHDTDDGIPLHTVEPEYQYTANVRNSPHSRR